MNEKKITKRDRYTTLLTFNEVKADPDMVEFIQHEMELLNRKATNKKQTAQQIAAENLRNTIWDFMEPNRLYTCTELANALDDDNTILSTSRISSAMQKLKEEGRVNRIEDKRKAYYQRVECGG